MKVVFLQNVQGSGRTGEIKQVADGFARNYLLPRRLAAPATPDAIKRAEARAAAEARRQAELDEQARALAEGIAAPIVITARVGEQGRLYGSVTSGDIAEEVSKLVGEEVDRHLVVLEEPIKTLGTYEVPLRLTRNVEATVIVEVVGEGVSAEEAEAMAEGAAAEEAEALGEGVMAEEAEETPEEAEEEEQEAQEAQEAEEEN